MNFQPNTLVLFDIDGTLTEARSIISRSVLIALRELCRYAEVGFVTGSDLEYIKEQLWPALNDPIIRINCHLLPCNGTKYYIPYGDDDPKLQEIHNVSMIEEIEEEKFSKLMGKLCVLQSEIVQEMEYELSLSGHFIQNRKSMINWCPIGRDADQTQRERFKALDKLYKIRNRYLEILKTYIKSNNLNLIAKLGGNTSFDIFPTGWDKTYALTHYNENEWDFWFVGDRCSVDGNDFELFNLLKPKGRAFETAGPEETVEIIDFHILKHIAFEE